MCGIAGIVDTSGAPVERDIVGAMTRALAHRGPDDEGTWFGTGVGLGHRRLSIIDLSSAGHQPMCNEDGNLWITYNGEIYNAAQIRPELEALGHVFRSRTDTEVILHAYEQWGDDCLSRFNGMFAFAIWDEKIRQLFAARDRFGIKPLFYHFNGKQFIFGSEIKALFKCPLVPKRPNQQVAFEYLAAGALEDGSATFFDQIVSLPASHSLRVSEKSLEVRRYYRINTVRRLSQSELKDAAEHFRHLFADSVRLQFVSDVPVASNLSGGLDSTAVVSMAVAYLRQTNGDLPHHVFTASFSDSIEDERPFVDRVAQELPLFRHDVFSDGEHLIDKICQQTLRQDQPVMGAAMIAKGEVMRAAHDAGFKVVLEGQGADEYCCGYPSDALWAIADQLLRGRLLSAAKQLRAYCTIQNASLSQAIETATDIAFPRAKTLASRLKRAVLLSVNRDDTFPWVNADFRRQRKVAHLPRFAAGELDNMCLRSMFKRNLPFYLRSDDHNAMAFGVEVREPFLDHRLVDFVFSLPTEYRIRNGVSKWIVREALAGVVPQSIRTYPGKRAFPTPQSKWLLDCTREAGESLFCSNSSASRDYVSGDAVRGLLKDFKSGNNQLHGLIWRLMNFEIWLRTCG